MIMNYEMEMTRKKAVLPQHMDRWMEEREDKALVWTVLRIQSTSSNHLTAMFNIE
jgi:hypothetical protein